MCKCGDDQMIKNVKGLPEDDEFESLLNGGNRTYRELNDKRNLCEFMHTSGHELLHVQLF